MPRKNRANKKQQRPNATNNPNNAINPNEHKMCLIILDRSNYSATILTLENSNAALHANIGHYVIRVPLRTFFRCASIWSELRLVTVFWEPPLYGIPRDYLQTEITKVHYFVEFASDLAPISKAWAMSACLNTVQNIPIDDEVYVEIILFTEAMKDRMVQSITGYRHYGTTYRCNECSENIYEVGLGAVSPSEFASI